MRIFFAQKIVISWKWWQVQTYIDPSALIDDWRVGSIPIRESGELLIDLSSGDIIPVDLTRNHIQRLSQNPFLVRETVARRLEMAQAHLPNEYQLELKEGWRPVQVQAQLWQDTLRYVMASMPSLQAAEIRTEAARFTAPPDESPPHSTGGAVDVVLLHNRAPADVGWEFNRPGPGSASAYKVSAPARQNRIILCTALDSAGFINYPAEWWHWSYGDRYWAFQGSKSAAIYGTVQR